jgi:hypothetical protein
MNTASLKVIKTELGRIHPARLAELCLQLAKYKKENKELLTYLLFDAFDEKAYIAEVKLLTDQQFSEINKNNSYVAKKSIRKILAMVNKQVKFSGSKQTEVELLLHFCKKLRKQGIPLHANSTLGNLYQRQLHKIDKSMASLHEDLQFDYAGERGLL